MAESLSPLTLFPVTAEIPKCYLTQPPKNQFFLFNNKYYKQVDGVGMGSPLGPALTNIFTGSFESKCL